MDILFFSSEPEVGIGAATGDVAFENVEMGALNPQQWPEMGKRHTPLTDKIYYMINVIIQNEEFPEKASRYFVARDENVNSIQNWLIWGKILMLFYIIKTYIINKKDVICIILKFT